MTKLRICLLNNSKTTEWLKSIGKDISHWDLFSTYIILTLPDLWLNAANLRYELIPQLTPEEATPLLLMPNIESMVHYLRGEKLIHQFHPLMEIVHGTPYSTSRLQKLAAEQKYSESNWPSIT